MSGLPDRNDRAQRKRAEEWCIAWLGSAVVNLALLIAAAIYLFPKERGVGPFSLVARVETDEGDLERLIDTPDLEPLDFHTDLELPQAEPPPAPEVEIDLFAIGNTGSEGSGSLQGGTGGGGKGIGTEYFGTVAHGDRFVYILDKSISMNWNRHGRPGPGSRFDRARYELLRTVEKLSPGQEFYVILFSWTTRRMFDDLSPTPETIPATAENKQRLRQWLEGIEMGSGTDPRDAIVIALSIAPDAVFLLSDGDFNGAERGTHLFQGHPTPEELVEQLNQPYTPIHTIAYENPTSKERMEELAELSGGKYRYIPPMDSTANDSVPRRRRR